MRGFTEFELDKAKVLKMECELEFESKLYKIFEETSALKHTIRRIVRLLARDALKLSDASASPLAFWQGYNANSFMGLWKKFPELKSKTTKRGEDVPAAYISALIEVIKQIEAAPISSGFLKKEKALTPAQCADFIRFFGECVEMVMLDDYRCQTEEAQDKWDILAQIKQSYRRPTFHPTNREDQLIHQMAELDKRRGLTPDETLKNTLKDLELREDFFLEKGEQARRNRAKPTGRGGTELLTGSVLHDGKRNQDARGKISGIMGKEPIRGSIVKAIDEMFGLYAGADISGTTTDTMFAIDYGIEKLAYQQSTIAHDSNEQETQQDMVQTLEREALPLLFLLPLATIGGHYHHTLIEIAMPLSLNEIVNYHVGLYTTLWPSRVSEEYKSSNNTGGAEIWKLMQEYEADPRNRKLLVYLNPESGCRCGFELGYNKKGEPHDADIERFKKIAKLDSLWLEHFTASEHQYRYPDKELIKAVLHWSGVSPEELEEMGIL